MVVTQEVLDKGEVLNKVRVSDYQEIIIRRCPWKVL